MVILKRLEKFAKDKNYFSHLQFGFENGTGSIEASFLINEAINHFVERGSKVFACFLDVRKPFDTVWLDGLFFKLFSELKVQGKILSIVKTLYSKTQCFVYLMAPHLLNLMYFRVQDRAEFWRLFVQSLCK